MEKRSWEEDWENQMQGKRFGNVDVEKKIWKSRQGRRFGKVDVGKKIWKSEFREEDLEKQMQGRRVGIVNKSIYREEYQEKQMQGRSLEKKIQERRFEEGDEGKKIWKSK